MCRALKVLCAAPGRERLVELRRAAVAAHWELVGGAASGDEVLGQMELHRPDVVVLDASLGAQAVDAIRRAPARALVVSVGVLPGADVQAMDPDGVREAILTAPGLGGPVRR